MRCPNCGNENPETHRFCGMCGASLLQGPGAAMAAPGNSIPGSTSAIAPRTGAPGATATATRATTPQTAANVTARATAPEPAPPTPTATIAPPQPGPRPAQRAIEQEPIISGPSFLGLNQPASTAKRGSLSIDPNSAPRSGNLDYLLEDDEAKSGGGWKVVLILVALALAVSFGYLRWKNGGLPFLNPPSKPAAQVPADTQAPPSANTSAITPVGTNSTNAPAGSAVPSATPSPTAANSTATTTATPGAQTGTTSQPSPSGPTPPKNAATGSSNPANSSAANSDSTSRPAIAPANPPESAANSVAEPSSEQAPASSEPEKPSTTKTSAANKPDDAASGSADNEATADDSTPATEAARKPPAAIKKTDPVTEAQRYLYGKGVAQDCDRGLRLLKPAANEGNPKAMIEMGALYSAGLCAPHDLPTSYRWFAMALRKDPANQSVATDLQKLWGEMTQPERQLAIRLSQ